MSRKGNCWNNAPTESFWGRLKTASLYGKKFATRREAMDAVLDWMAFYNHRRLHSTLGYLSPMHYEQRWYAAQQKRLHKTRAKNDSTQGQGQSASRRNPGTTDATTA